ncbi:MAG: Uma2 family endonuclease [Pseudanabaenaceae cyanobacterium SKYGB_i_bin29]|nr:Uma2 family endonuclease [Pseudanabaenaceae cyanobacterium SKYG29]MDW8422380.1 Uma2 family endonuclease [Pseudanabaenaceae cyanobacterium SKYGB_i_bin29]
MVSIQKEWTDKDFMNLPEDGQSYELVNGELVVMGTAGARHGYYAALMTFFLAAHCRAHRTGIVFDADTSFKMASSNLRSPACAVFSRARLKALGGIPSGYISGAPPSPKRRKRFDHNWSL